MALICALAVFIWTIPLPIYALDLSEDGGNSTVHHSTVKSTDSEKSLDVKNQLKDTTSGKYNDIQDLRLEVLEILEQIRLSRDENEISQEISMLEDASSDHRKNLRYLISQ